MNSWKEWIPRELFIPFSKNSSFQNVGQEGDRAQDVCGGQWEHEKPEKEIQPPFLSLFLRDK